MSNAELHVIFGTGPLGKGAARELAQQGKKVRMVNRSGQASDLPASVEVVKADAYDAADTRRVTEGATAVYQCAQPEYHEWTTKFMPLQTAIMAGAITNQAKFIVGDNLYMYGDPDGKPITEKSPYQPITKKGRVRLEMAQAVMQAHEAGKVRVAIGRAAHFFGPEYHIGGDFIFYPALAGKKVSMYGSLDAPHTFTYVPDYGKALATLGTDDRSLGEIWIAPSQPALTQRELACKIYQAAGSSQTNPSQVGRLLMRMVGLFNAGARETVEMMYEFEKPYIVDSSKIEKTFGIAPTPLEEAIRSTVTWFKAHPQQAH